ncbi:hypothetical protein G7054_g14333 [Neopestalotiopsis clavispora]|nr:hypothetical protein G7054_g14333 [Neopestalotiopsis clavispora]
MWLDQPVTLHGSREDDCELTVEQCAYRAGHWRYWYIADWVYALGTIYFFMATIAVCTFGFWALRLAPKSLRANKSWQKLVSSFRFLAYKHSNSRALYSYLPSLGVGILLVIGGAFFFLMTLGPQPYYWPNTRTLTYAGSPPIATRAGWMALACLPFVVILPTKANTIASFTGVSHDRLIVFHNWVGWAMFVLALIHTFPFIIYHQWVGDLSMQWTMSIFYWSGTAALICQAYLQFMSISWIRNRFYEFFKLTHFAAAILFILFLFFHCDYTLSSWDYFIAAGVLYTLSWLYSQTRIYFEHGISRRATFEMVSDVCMKITIPIDAKWTTAQHVFLRFLTLDAHSLAAHPFTICSIPAPGEESGKTKMVFYVQPRGGTTGRLAKMAAKQPGYTVPVLIDGPYGGVQSRPLTEYNRSVVVTCGSGAALSLGPAMDVIAKSVSHSREKMAHRMHIVIATRDQGLLQWFEDALLAFMEDIGASWPAEQLGISIYQTGSSDSTRTSSDEEKGGSNKVSSTAQGRLPITVYSGRPNLSALVRDATLESEITVGILACGPAGVLQEVQSEAAAAQLRILKSEAGAREVYLHSELFS